MTDNIPLPIAIALIVTTSGFVYFLVKSWIAAKERDTRHLHHGGNQLCFQHGIGHRHRPAGELRRPIPDGRDVLVRFAQLLPGHSGRFHEHAAGFGVPFGTRATSAGGRSQPAWNARKVLCGAEHGHLRQQQCAAGWLVKRRFGGACQTNGMRGSQPGMGGDAGQHLVLGRPGLEQCLQHHPETQRHHDGLRCAWTGLVRGAEQPFGRGKCGPV